MPDLKTFDSYTSSASLSQSNFPSPGSDEEKAIFRRLQAGFPGQYEYSFPDKLAPKTVVIIPSLTLDQEILRKIDGIVHYEERMLCMLLLLRMPRTNIIFVSSTTIDPVIIDYYLHLLPGITGYHARQRLQLLSCYDSSPLSLTQKILERPRLIKRIKDSIPHDHSAHIAFFNTTPYERTLAVRLGIPIFGCDPDLVNYGNKSMGRKLFRQSGLAVPDGFEDLHTREDVAKALATLKEAKPSLRKAVVKMNDGFSGEGNAIYYYPDAKADCTYSRILENLPKQLKVVAPDLDYEKFMQYFESMEGVVEEFIDGEKKESPSVQGMINPLGRCQVLSTHDQLLGGEGGQVFLGAYFPARPAYAGTLGVQTLQLCELLKKNGVLGRFGVDFLSVKKENTWEHYAIEINLRKGGTTHPYLMLQFLTEGSYNAETGEYLMQNGRPRYYFSSDNLVDESFKGLTPHDLIEIAMDNEIMFNGATQEGVMFHLIGALSQYGKLGVVCIANSPKKAAAYYQKTVDVLKKEGGKTGYK